ncbi:hypothetical protein PLICRDRAFT_57229 [Plicaturopsis crispa FD-325 SS-3]|uniref:Unplaced genomic scaffold PLICRscaffold_15, whole genome shotgun sequence n=1 Tax=Plicaturopsis crispa FD-325 SS-3 TaxID=944288 RepID=A0A0C9SYX5_PLICR|nr:hypothetical protein PLICRDRAFT_57229 [Plicaturopsis crispa FD-325 SS-3]
MLAAILLASLAVAASATPFGPTPSITGSWNAPSPTETSTDTYEVHTKDANWATFETWRSSWDFADSGADEFGYRLKGQDDTAAIVKYDGAGANIVNVTYNSDNPDIQGTVSVAVQVNATFGASASKRDSWDGLSNYSPVAFPTVPVSVVNIMCADDLNFTVIVTNADGTTQTSTGTDGVELSVTRPANVTVNVAGHEAGGLTASINSAEPFTAAFGSGAAPEIAVIYGVQIGFCPD